MLSSYILWDTRIQKKIWRILKKYVCFGGKLLLSILITSILWTLLTQVDQIVRDQYFALFSSLCAPQVKLLSNQPLSKQLRLGLLFTAVWVEPSTVFKKIVKQLIGYYKFVIGKYIELTRFHVLYVVQRQLLRKYCELYSVPKIQGFQKHAIIVWF